MAAQIESERSGSGGAMFSRRFMAKHLRRLANRLAPHPEGITRPERASGGGARPAANQQVVFSQQYLTARYGNPPGAKPDRVRVYLDGGEIIAINEVDQN